MHQARRPLRATVTRFLAPSLAAGALALTLTIVTGYSPLCVLYEPWSFLWIWNQCWEAPPPSPEG